MSKTFATPQWLRDLQFFVRRMSAALPNRHFSNFGEQQIIDKYLSLFCIGDKSKTIVDIGAGDGIRSSNTYHLFSSGWRGLGIEVDDAKYRRLKTAYKAFAGVAASNEKVSPANVADVLASHAVEREFALLSIDIDGNDYWVLDAILANYRPRLIVSEYNEKIPPPIRFVVEFDPDFELRHHFFGYSIAKLDDLLKKHDYALLEVEYNNVFLAPAETQGVQPMSAIDAYRAGYSDRTDRRDKFAGNENMEPLQSLGPEKGVEFLNEFYSEFAGKYSVDLD
jgi:hypothetical protein